MITARHATLILRCTDEWVLLKQLPDGSLKAHPVIRLLPLVSRSAHSLWGEFFVCDEVTDPGEFYSANSITNIPPFGLYGYRRRFKIS